MKIYLMGSLRNPKVVEVGNFLRENGFDTFDDWASAGSVADENWRDYEKQRGRTYKQALQGYAAKHIFALDKRHLDLCDVGVLLMPAGKSAHLELGYLLGKGKPGFVLFDEEPERYDVMYQFATDIVFNKEDLLEQLNLLYF
jgi:nucleoside 2-deoxyribosyltransferase